MLSWQQPVADGKLHGRQQSAHTLPVVCAHECACVSVCLCTYACVCIYALPYTNINRSLVLGFIDCPLLSQVCMSPTHPVAAAAALLLLLRLLRLLLLLLRSCCCCHSLLHIDKWANTVRCCPTLPHTLTRAQWGTLLLCVSCIN